MAATALRVADLRQSYAKRETILPLPISLMPEPFIFYVRALSCTLPALHRGEFASQLKFTMAWCHTVLLWLKYGHRDTP